MNSSASGHRVHSVQARSRTSTDTARLEDDNNDLTLDDQGNSVLGALSEWGLVAIGSLALAILVRAFLLQSFFIPSSSMESTLTIDDRVLVNKLSYVRSDPSRGDVIVFTRPQSVASPVDHLIKRVIAIGGDTVESRDGLVFVNGEPLDEAYLAEGSKTSTFGPIQIGVGMLWVMGDSRNNSSDSRVFGQISVESVTGRSFVQIWPLNAMELL